MFYLSNLFFVRGLELPSITPFFIISFTKSITNILGLNSTFLCDGWDSSVKFLRWFFVLICGVSNYDTFGSLKSFKKEWLGVIRLFNELSLDIL